MPLALGNVREESMAALWRGSRYGQAQEPTDSRLSRWQDVKLRDYHECGSYDRCTWCSKCPGMSFVETGDPLSVSEVQCRIAAARMEAAQRLEAGESRAAIFESLGLPEDFGATLEVRPLASVPVTTTIDPRQIGGRKFDARKASS